MQPAFPPPVLAPTPPGPRLRAELTALLEAALDECAALDDLERIGYGTLTLDSGRWHARNENEEERAG